MHAFFHEPRSWVAIAFVIFFAIFGSKLWQALTAMLDKHTASVRTELDEATRLRTEAQAMLTDATARREAVIAEARGMIDNAHAEAHRVGEQARADAEAAGQRREKMALERIAAAEKAAVTEVRLAAADIAVRAAEQVLRETLDAGADAPIIDHSIASLPGVLARARAA